MNVKIKHHKHKNSHKHDKHEKENNSYKQKKSFYSKGVSDSSEESNESSSGSDREETLFMEIETKIDEDKEMMDSEEGETLKQMDNLILKKNSCVH
jgi:hypothetical protein